MIQKPPIKKRKCIVEDPMDEEEPNEIVAIEPTLESDYYINELEEDFNVDPNEKGEEEEEEEVDSRELYQIIIENLFLDPNRFEQMGNLLLDSFDLFLQWMIYRKQDDQRKFTCPYFSQRVDRTLKDCRASIRLDDFDLYQSTITPLFSETELIHQCYNCHKEHPIGFQGQNKQNQKIFYLGSTCGSRIFHYLRTKQSFDTLIHLPNDVQENIDEYIESFKRFADCLFECSKRT